jgi:hypothetical protein
MRAVLARPRETTAVALNVPSASSLARTATRERPRGRPGALAERGRGTTTVAPAAYDTPQSQRLRNTATAAQKGFSSSEGREWRFRPRDHFGGKLADFLERVNAEDRQPSTGRARGLTSVTPAVAVLPIRERCLLKAPDPHRASVAKKTHKH